MGHTYSRILVHAVFSTKDREPIILAPFRQRLYEYMAGIAREEFGQALRVGGVADHVHGLILLKTDASLAHAMNRWKSLSSGWVNKVIRPATRFAWQTGYGAFSVSESSTASVTRYINNQEEHHRTQTFQEEFLVLLKRHQIPHDPATVWE